MKMSFGNHIGFASDVNLPGVWHLGFTGYLVAELTEDVAIPGVMKIGMTTEEAVIALDGDVVSIDEL